MEQKMIDVESITQDFVKSLMMEIAFVTRAISPPKFEQAAGHIPYLRDLFVRTRDILVSDHLGIVYSPVPKSACTLFATMLLLKDPRYSDFDPAKEGVHRYRFRRGALRPKNFDCFTDSEYFRFTVVRDPCKRAVSGYVDKFVKPFMIHAELDRSRAKAFSFRDFVEVLCSTNDGRLDKHWRPQYRFFEHLPLDYIGAFEALDEVYSKVRDRTGIDVQAEISEKVYDKARTGYDASWHESGKHPSDMTPLELAALDAIPPATAFLTQGLRDKLEARYARDKRIHDIALKRDSG